MVQKMAMKTAKKMSEHSVIDVKSIRIYAYGLELLYSSLVGGVAMIAISAVYGKPFLWIPYLAGFYTATAIRGWIPCKNTFLLYFHILLALCPRPANREIVYDPGERTANCLRGKSCYHYFVFTSSCTQ